MFSLLSRLNPLDPIFLKWKRPSLYFVCDHFLERDVDIKLNTENEKGYKMGKTRMVQLFFR